ncbi:biopolymer transport protein ExbD/TolR [Aquimarina sp. MAR_2010_214]|uniref:ExbD/TolR family protein n=1 Tax=Aquimarina sp. MAR_2010_214 TaxID=1250026 RepID=UPI000C703551|nr:biopolymer transporter ExbD [Aquimarina sp. MAR_2010_214]PKV49370.1 biopolymer transport protein ExbD/TolR [Aquimarina sp. MAR_2010_214]
MTRRLRPSVNAGSMADIAFLLLIFFLVSTKMETDYGITRKLSPPADDYPTEAIIMEKNLFKVELNQLNELSVEGTSMKISALKDAAIAFLDNGGGFGELACNYCKGEGDVTSSDHPTKAIISLINNRETNYATYVAVQNELVAAYTELRNREAKRLYGFSFTEIRKSFKDARNPNDKEVLRERIKTIQSLYPEKITEAEPRNQY